VSASIGPEIVVVGLTQPWGDPACRTEHLVRCLSQRLPVIVVEPPAAGNVDRDEVSGDAAIRVVRPFRAQLLGSHAVDAQTLDTVRSLVAGRRVGVWLDGPEMADLVDACAPSFVVYDLAGQTAMTSTSAQDAVLSRADVVLVPSRERFDAFARLGTKMVLVPSGIDVDVFGAQVAPFPLVAGLRGPVFGVIAAVDASLDYDLLAALADAIPDGHVVVVGPIGLDQREATVLPQRPNVHFTGAIPYGMLPSVIAGFDVGLIPNANANASPALAARSVATAFAYVAAGKPVVASVNRDVAGLSAETIAVANDHGAFVESVRAALATPRESIERSCQRVRSYDWDAIFERVWERFEAR